MCEAMNFPLGNHFAPDRSTHLDFASAKPKDGGSGDGRFGLSKQCLQDSTSGGQWVNQEVDYGRVCHTFHKIKL